MRSKKGGNTGVYAYLDRLGLLEHGSDEAIKAAKQAYRKLYKYEWQRAYRKQKSITLYFSAEEYRSLSQAAGKHRMSKTRFGKKALIGYIRRQYVVPDLEIIYAVVQLLTGACSLAEQLLRSEKVSFKEGKQLVEETERIESVVRETLFKPRTLEELLQDAINKNAGLRPYFLDFIKNVAGDH